MAMHIPLHICLILGATALGILVELVGEAAGSAVKSSEVSKVTVLRTVMRAGDAVTAEGGAHHAVPDAVVWLVCCAYGGALASMLVLSLLHDRHDHRHITSVPRHVLRGLVILCCFPLLPLVARQHLSALALLGVLGGIITLLALVEVFFSQYDDHYSAGYRNEIREEMGHPSDVKSGTE
jgi:hypothetical protein